MISERIKLLRNRSGFTQSDLAKRLNITRSSVNAWEMGISVPSTQYLVELANLFQVSADYILGLDSSKSINIDNLSDEERSIILGLLHYFNKDGEKPTC